jgi:hypothetical protein
MANSRCHQKLDARRAGPTTSGLFYKSNMRVHLTERAVASHLVVEYTVRTKDPTGTLYSGLCKVVRPHAVVCARGTANSEPWIRITLRIACEEMSHATRSSQKSATRGGLAEKISALERELILAERGQESREAALLYLRSIEEWSSALGAAMADASHEEKRFLIRGLKTRVTCYSTHHDPRYIIEFDLAKLRESLRQLLPRLTDRDIAAY